MRLLVIGGTPFLGRHVVEAALERGDRVTLFNRGSAGRDLYPEAEQLQGDREGDLEPLKGRSWDAVIDTCGYLPRVVGKSARFLADQVGHYGFVSSMSVYTGAEAGEDESAPVSRLPDPTVEQVTPETYGGLKKLCEEAVEEAMPGRALHVRAGMIVGRYDNIHRLRYWLERIPEGGEVLAPARPESPLQLIDARDIADWMLRCAERKVAGVFNVSGPIEPSAPQATAPLTLGGLLEAIRAVTGSDARFVWTGDEFLAAEGIQFDEMPYGLPETYAGFFRRDLSRAASAGLTTRPLEQTLRETLAWLATKPSFTAKKPMSIQVGMSREKEAALLAKVKAQAV